MARKFDVAVVGATGAVGEAMLEILAQRRFPVNNVYPLASERSAGKNVPFAGKHLTVEDLATFDFSKVRIGLFSAGASISKQYAPLAAAAGCVVIDNTSQYRYDDEIPLVVPEVNPDAIAGYTRHGIIANPNCSTIQMLVALKPLHDAAGIERINVCTYQAVSGTGKEAIEELASQTAALLDGRDPEVSEVYFCGHPVRELSWRHLDRAATCWTLFRDETLYLVFATDAAGEYDRTRICDLFTLIP